VKVLEDALYNVTLDNQELIEKGWSGTLLQPSENWIFYCSGFNESSLGGYKIPLN
jgi:hypothetical protein